MDRRIFVSPIITKKPCNQKLPSEQPNLKMPHNFTRLTKVDDEVLQNHTIVFNVEETLLKSSSLFPYFMLVAFEGGGLIRALILLLLYPFLCILGKEIGLKVMVFISFFGIKKESFRIGTSVLPKFFLENVGCEGFDVVMKFGRKVGVTKLPRVMVESFLKDYLQVQDIVGEKIKVVGGYYLGVIDDKDEGEDCSKDILGFNSQVIGIGGTHTSWQTYPFTNCKDIYMVSEGDKKWHQLPRAKYPKPLIFHDGRLAFMPTPLNTLVMFMWLPFGTILCIIRIMVGLFLPYSMSTPILASIGISYSSSSHPPFKDYHNHNSKEKSIGFVYVCNHRLVLDPVYISYICRMHLTALTYSVSKLSQFLSPIKTITLTRNREKDAEIMSKVLSKGNIVVCPEGTTCREPYLLRFSPLFAEISDNIIPLAVQVKVSMFYGTTASGIKALDPFFHMMNPWPYCHVKFLDIVPRERTCGHGGASKFDVANYVQAEIGKALGYKCTELTRKDKYLILAGNTGIVGGSKRHV